MKSTIDTEVGEVPGTRSQVALVRFDANATELALWLKQNRSSLEQLLRQHGAVLLRGARLASAEEFEQCIHVSSSAPWRGNPNLFSPRHQVHGSVYTSTDGWFEDKKSPEAGPIAQHCEFSHSPFRRWPMKLYFFCEQAPASGGETPLANPRRVMDRISKQTRDLFLKKGLKYRRVFYHDEVRWQQVFQSDDPRAVEAICRDLGIAFEWRVEGRDLATQWELHVAAQHPDVPEWAWFNQAHVVAFAAIPTYVREHFLAKHGYEGRPVDCTFGDGSSIPDELLAEVQAAYDAETVAFAWQQGDLLIIDNMMMSHGRSPFRAPRRILVGMADPASASEVKTA